jgi:glycosyltransferase involved in cell wall biosynthesis
MNAGVAVVLKGWPRLSETFIARELAALETRGLAISLWSLRRPADTKTHPAHGAVQGPVAYLPEYLHEEPARVWAAWRAARRLPGYRQAARLFRADLARDPSRNRVRRFGQACVLAAELPPGTRALYAHFLHTPASVARYAAVMRGLAFAVSAHARDIWTSKPWDRAEKLRAARFTTVCTEDGFARLRQDAPDAEIILTRHGLDTARWKAPQTARKPRDGGDAGDPVTILSVGRAVEKKGYPDLIAALAALPASLHWRFEHIGGGPERETLMRLARGAGIAPRCGFRGSKAEAEVMAAMHAADLFALAPVIADDGDRDGLPNVLVEAQACALAVAATRTGGVAELILDGETGLLTGPGDPKALAASLARLIAEPETRARFGAAGRARVETRFADAPGFDTLAARLRAMIGEP